MCSQSRLSIQFNLCHASFAKMMQTSSLCGRIYSLMIENMPRTVSVSRGLTRFLCYLPELHRSTKLLVLEQDQQSAAQRLVPLSGLVESRDVVHHRFHAGGIHDRLAYQALPHECRMAASLFRQHRLGGRGAGESADRRVPSATRRGPGRVRLARVPPDLERGLNREGVIGFARS